MLEQMQTKDSKSIWKLQYKGSLLVEYAIILGLAAIFLVFNGFFDPIGDKAEKNAKAVNKDAYVYGGVPKGSVTQTPDDNNTPPTHSSGGQIIAATPGSSVKPGDIPTNIDFTYDNTGKIWSTDKMEKYDLKENNTRYFSIGTLLSFGSEAKGKYRIFFNESSKANTTNTNQQGEVYLPVGKSKKDFARIQIQVIIYKYDDQGNLIIEVLNPSGAGGDGYFSIGDVELYIDRPCYVAFNFRGVANVVGGNGNDDPKEEFIKQYMKIVKL